MVDSWRLKPRKLGFIHSYQVCKLDLEPVEWYVRSRNWKKSRCLVREMVKLRRKACWVWGFGALCRHTHWHTNHTYQPPHMVSDLDSGTFLQGFILFPAFRLFNFRVCIDPFQTHLAWSLWWRACSCLCCAVFPTKLLCHKKKHATFTKRLGKWFKPSFPKNMTILKNWPQHGQLQSVFFFNFLTVDFEFLSHGSFYRFSKHQNPRKKSHQGPDPQTRQGANPPMLWPNVRSFHCWQCKIQSHPRWLRPALFVVWLGGSQAKNTSRFFEVIPSEVSTKLTPRNSVRVRF